MVTSCAVMEVGIDELLMDGTVCSPVVGAGIPDFWPWEQSAGLLKMLIVI